MRRLMMLVTIVLLMLAMLVFAGAGFRTRQVSRTLQRR